MYTEIDVTVSFRVARGVYVRTGASHGHSVVPLRTSRLPIADRWS
jgi:hypothetical protein